MKTLQWLGWIGLSILLLAFAIPKASAQDITGLWYNAEKDAKVQIYKATDGKYYGKIVWLKDPMDENNKPKTDKKNPDEKKRNTPVLDLIILRGLTKDNDKEYSGGTIYDPKSGKKYDCELKVKSATELSIRGFVGISLIGRTTVWTKAK